MSDGNRAQTFLFDAESISQLSPERKADYVKLAIKECISRHPGGITAQLIAESTGIIQRTVKKYLDQMTATREIYTKEYGTRIVIYFPIGKNIQETESTIVRDRDTAYKLQKVENSFGRFVYLQEMKKDIKTGMMKIVGGVMIDMDSVKEIVGALQKLHASELMRYEEGS